MSTARRRARIAVAAALLSLFGLLHPASLHAQDGPWRMQRRSDEMTGTVTDTLSKDFRTNAGAFRGTASCAYGMLNFAFDSLGGGRLDWQESETYSGTTFGFSTQLTRNVKRWVALRIRIDQQEVQARSSSSKYSNEVEIVFYDPREIQRQAGLHDYRKNPPNGGRPQLDAQGMGKFFEDFTFQLLPALMPQLAAGTIDDLLRGQTLKVEIPMADGRAPIITVSLADPALRQFASSCANPLSAPGQSLQESRGRTGAQNFVLTNCRSATNPSIPSSTDIKCAIQIVYMKMFGVDTPMEVHDVRGLACDSAAPRSGFQCSYTVNSGSTKTNEFKDSPGKARFAFDGTRWALCPGGARDTGACQ